jgi:predicted adenylyl cyclase CyaB
MVAASAGPDHRLFSRAGRPVYDRAVARNVEVKIRVGDLEAIRARALALGAEDRGLLTQVDTYFGTLVAGARLKLREHRPGPSQLIAYRRPDRADLRTSDFHVVPVDDPARLREALSHALGVVRRVAKTRRLLLLGRTRIHLDRVEGLGDFLELEVVLDETDAVTGGEQEAEEILAQLALGGRPRIAGSYGDL